MKVARYVSEARLRKRGRSGIHPRLSEAKSRVIEKRDHSILPKARGPRRARFWLDGVEIRAQRSGVRYSSGARRCAINEVLANDFKDQKTFSIQSIVYTRLSPVRCSCRSGSFVLEELGANSYS